MASYNNYFPQTYGTNPSYVYGATATPAQTWTTPAPSTNNSNGINWVQGEAGARSIPVPAGQKVLLMDSETNVFYIKASDMSGMPLPLRTFKYEEIGVDNTPKVDPAQTTYITKEELESRLDEFKKSLGETKNEKQFAI